MALDVKLLYFLNNFAGKSRIFNTFIVFLTTLLMNIGRIVAGARYPSDILDGIVIGVVIGYIFFFCAEKKRTKAMANI